MFKVTVMCSVLVVTSWAHQINRTRVVLHAIVLEYIYISDSTKTSCVCNIFTLVKSLALVFLV